MCRFFGLSRAAFYAWQKRQGQPDPDQRRLDLVLRAYRASRRTYGYRRIQLWIQLHEGVQINHKTVLRLMNKLGIRVPRSHIAASLDDVRDLAETLGLKREQVEGIRDPHHEMLEELESDQDRVKKMAARYLEKVKKRTGKAARTDSPAAVPLVAPTQPAEAPVAGRSPQ